MNTLQNLILRCFLCISGSAVTALAMVLMTGNGMGSDSMTMLVEGLAKTANISPGTASLILNLIYLGLGIIFARRYLGFGTVTTALVTGIFIDCFSQLTVDPDSLITAILSILLYCFGIALTMSARLGVGAYEAFLIGASERFKIRYKYLKIASDALFFLTALVLGGVFGWVTILSVFMTGPLIVQFLKPLDALLKQKQKNDLMR